MQELPEEWRETMMKLAILSPGVILGLTAKLSKLNKERKLTWGAAFSATAVAFMTATIVYYVLAFTGHDKWSVPAAVLCGRFGDEILIFLWKAGKEMIKSALNSMK